MVSVLTFNPNYCGRWNPKLNVLINEFKATTKHCNSKCCKTESICNTKISVIFNYSVLTSNSSWGLPWIGSQHGWQLMCKSIVCICRHKTCWVMLELKIEAGTCSLAPKISGHTCFLSWVKIKFIKLDEYFQAWNYLRFSACSKGKSQLTLKLTKLFHKYAFCLQN